MSREISDTIDPIHSGSLPALTPVQEAKDEIDQLFDLGRRVFDVVFGGRSAQALRPLVEEAREFFEKFDDGGPRRLASAARPATSQQIAEILAATTGSIPGSYKVNAGAFSINLARQINALRPSRVGLESGCDQVLLQCEEFPTIAKFVSIVREADFFVKGAAARVVCLKNDLAEARQIIRDRDEEVARRVQREARDAGNVTAIRPTA